VTKLLISVCESQTLRKRRREIPGLNGLGIFLIPGSQSGKIALFEKYPFLFAKKAHELSESTDYRSFRQEMAIPSGINKKAKN
jgi:hypothetical protein